MSDELDDQMLNGDGMNDDLTGIFERLTDPVAPAAGVVNFDGFIAAFADGIDGLVGDHDERGLDRLRHGYLQAQR